MKDIIIKTDKTQYSDDLYEHLLDELEVEIKDYVLEYFNGNYENDCARYLWEYHDYCVHCWNIY